MPKTAPEAPIWIVSTFFCIHQNYQYVPDFLLRQSVRICAYTASQSIQSTKSFLNNKSQNTLSLDHCEGMPKMWS